MKNKTKNILNSLLLVFLLVGGLIPASAISETGLGFKQPTQDSIIYDVKELNFFEKIFSTFSLIGLSSSYSSGQTISVRVSERLNQFCSGPSYVIMEVYKVPAGQHTTSNYVGGNSFKLADNLNPNSFSASFSYNIPSTTSGTWSMSGYIYCPSKDPTPASSYSTITEQNFNIQTTQLPQCTNECSSGTKICTTQGGYRNRYITTCGNYDSDSCTEYQTSGLIDCGGIDTCSNGQCISTPPPTQNPSVQVISTDIKVQGKQIVGNVILKNNGISMTQNYVVEMQVVPQTSGFLTILNPSQYQTTCDPNHPENVNLPFSLASGSQQQYVLISPQTGELTDNTYKGIFYLRTKCYDGTSDSRQVPGTVLEGYGETQSLVIGIGGTGGGGTGKLANGESCTLTTDTFGDDGYQTSTECASGWCKDRFFSNRGQGICADNPGGTIIDGGDGTTGNGGSNQNITTPATQTSLTYQDWKDASSATRLKTVCSVKENCLPYEDLTGNNKEFNVQCKATGEITTILAEDSKKLCDKSGIIKIGKEASIISGATCAASVIATAVTGGTLAPITVWVCSGSIAIGANTLFGCSMFSQDASEISKGACIAIPKSSGNFLTDTLTTIPGIGDITGLTAILIGFGLLIFVSVLPKRSG